MSIKNYYDSLEENISPPKTNFINRVMAECGVNRATVYRWINGTVTPGKLQQEKLAEITRISVDKLFPVAELKEA